ncbi:DUF3168 domain-containing protein [Sphingomonas montana]|uniref:DUF3168 domain-containing protein n=1 Tax=Sphingomonas montana TaxID=1843236 RepID=UPI00096D4D5E|nr:DUF3168 domain-containing protein [Sphingomonas montana]
MSDAAGAVQAALVAALRAGLGDRVTGVFDGPPAGAKLPYAAIGEATTSAWGAKGLDGREHRIAVVLWDEGGRPSRLHALMAVAEDAIEEMPRELAGHSIVGLLFLRARLVRDAGRPWAGLVEYRVRTVPVP